MDRNIYRCYKQTQISILHCGSLVEVLSLFNSKFKTGSDNRVWRSFTVTFMVISESKDELIQLGRVVLETGTLRNYG